jgi:hypothetical protein
MAAQVLVYLGLAVGFFSDCSSVILWSVWKLSDHTSYLHEFNVLRGVLVEIHVSSGILLYAFIFIIRLH